MDAELYIWQLMEALDLPDVARRLAHPWLTGAEADRFCGAVGTNELEMIARLVRLAAIHCMRAMEGTGQHPHALVEAGAWLLNLARALELPNADGASGPRLSTSTWRAEVDGPLVARLGKCAPVYRSTTAEAVAVVAEWCEKQGKGPWEAPEGWTPGGAWILPGQR